MLIVNADDLGYNSSTNAAILESFDRQYCSSATLMANMPGLEEAAELIHANRLANHIGLHLNLSEGTPLTDKIRRSSRLCDREGQFRLLRHERILWLSRADQELLANEIRAQVARLRVLRLPITHLDSHKNLHEEWGIFRVILNLIEETRIPYIRLSRNIGRPSSCVKSAYRLLVNRCLRRRGLSRTQWFGSFTDFDDELHADDPRHVRASCELMVHPCYDDAGTLIDLCTRQPLSSTCLRSELMRAAVSYSGARPASVRSFTFLTTAAQGATKHG